MEQPDFKSWNTILELKEDHKKLGLKGAQFFIIDFPSSLRTNELEYIISQPTFNGLIVGSSIASFILTKEELLTFFKVSTITFDELAIEIENAFFKNQ